MAELRAEQQAELNQLSSDLGEVLPDDLDDTGADRLIAELKDRRDHGESAYLSE